MPHISPDSENTCRGNMPSHCNSPSENKQLGRTLSGQSRPWPDQVHPGPVFHPDVGTAGEREIEGKSPHK